MKAAPVLWMALFVVAVVIAGAASALGVAYVANQERADAILFGIRLAFSLCR